MASPWVQQVSIKNYHSEFDVLYVSYPDLTDMDRRGVAVGVLCIAGPSLPFSRSEFDLADSVNRF